MFGGHGQDYFYDGLAFGLSLIPFAIIVALIAASLLKEPPKHRASVRERKARNS
jgi:heme exporter protein D